MKKISVFGSTGIIGSKAIEIAHSSGFEIVAISGHTNIEKLLKQADIYRPQFVCVTTNDGFQKVREALSNRTEISVLPPDEINNMAKLNVDCCVMSISGNAAIYPTFSSLGYAKRLAIANKESIISGGNILMDLAQRNHTEVIPIDSEHNAILQCISGEQMTDIEEIILTASGGPFLDFEDKDLKNVTIDDALKHPNWNMGKKITIDSSTLINKALEIIEAAYLFSYPIEKITSLIHPNSIIHGMIKFTDGVFKSIISMPDMKLPISFAMHYPKRYDCHTPSIDFAKLENLSFKQPKPWQKRNIDLAYLAFKEKKVIAFNIANEITVNKFLKDEIKFVDIYNVITEILERSQVENIFSQEDIFETITELNNRFKNEFN
jgi:1-deoxy-D-xylulose-5-phosphate reductoisomerase